MTHFKKNILLIVGIMCTFPISTMHDQADEHSKQLLEIDFYHTYEMYHESNTKLLKDILKNKGNPNIQDTDGDTPLHFAVNSKHADYVAILLAAGANPNIINNKGDTPLRMAASFNNLPVVQLLLNKWANPNITTHNNDSPLHSAVHKELNSQILKLLLSANADPNLKNGWGHTPLHQVMLSGTLNSNMITATQLFLQYGARHNSVSPEGCTPLQLLTSQQWEDNSHLKKRIVQHMGRLLVWHSLLLHDFSKLVPAEIAHFIAAYIAPLCATEPTIWTTKPVPLDLCFYETLDNVKLLKELLAHKANPNRQDTDYGYTPLHCAIEQKNSKYASILLAAQANPNIINNQGDTPLHYAASPKYSPAKLEIIQLLLNNKANPNAANNTGKTPLHFGIASRNSPVKLEIIQLLLNNKANPHCANNTGKTALHFAEASEDSPVKLEIIQLLLNNNVNPNAADNTGKTPLHFATASLYSPVKLEIIQLLLNNKANPNAADNLGETPLHAIGYFGSTQIVKCLLSAKADLSLKTQSGRTPFYYTILSWANLPDNNLPDNMKTAQLLLKHCVQVDSFNRLGYPLLGLNSRANEDHLKWQKWKGWINPKEEAIKRKIGRLAVWHYIISHEFRKLVSPEIAHRIASHAAAICAEQPTIWTERPSAYSCICM